MVLGRAVELKYLNTYYDREGSQIMVVYGEKNIGKTALLSQFVQDKPFHYYRARSASEREQRYQWGKELSKEEFFQMYENYLKITKNEENNFYKDNIFLYESLLEIEVFKEFVDNGFLVSNVYDCFWFDNNQITDDKVKSKINQQTTCLVEKMIA